MPQKLHCYTYDNCNTILWDAYYKRGEHYSYKDMAFCDDVCYNEWGNQEEVEDGNKKDRS